MDVDERPPFEERRPDEEARRLHRLRDRSRVRRRPAFRRDCGDRVVRLRGGTATEPDSGAGGEQQDEHEQHEPA
jgi:hypothetical protein